MAEIRLHPPESVERAPVWLAEAILWARDRGATDLHFFPSEGEAALWARIDGDLREVARYSISVHERMVARLKVLGRCSDYAGELAQEGRFSLNGQSAAGEARLSILPTLRGEKAVVRLLAGGGRLRRLGELGISGELVAALREATDRPQGLLLAVGPSGCGKSTALYALLDDLNERAGRPLSILTIEDPVEQTLPFAAQITADPARGLGFAAGLRALLRQDPEVIMIGEIRDPETSTAALQAALTGHRLLSSMHALTAAEALVRLQQMGSAPYEISSAVAGALNLRLARLLCPHCKSTRAISPDEMEWIPEAAAWPERVVGESAGCDQCLGSGRLGRTAVGEWIAPTPETAAALQARQPVREIARTLEMAVPARPAALSLLKDQRISVAEWRALDGLPSMRGN
ncbi:MAG: ATPase, T2SS/T4P/T4SS family [Candidatus Sumerlaeota bacterium]|nr:ATPase, T2SS/T4P/T4SS family [Candidatus Sumerlaeota bacterium]